MTIPVYPETKVALKGRKGLIVGIANDQSIAWGCARAFRALGADLAVTYLNERAKKHVQPLARSWRRRSSCRSTSMPKDKSTGFRTDSGGMGRTRFSASFHSVLAEGSPARSRSRCQS